MTTIGVFLTFSKDFCWPSRTKGIIGRDLKFAGYVPHYRILTGNIFGLILKNKMAATGVSLSVMKSAYYPTALKGCRGIVFTHGVRMGGRASGRAGRWAGGGK